MKDGFIKVAAASVCTSVADPKANCEEIKKRIHEADCAGVNVLVLPELAVTGYTCGDLFCSGVLLAGVKDALAEICAATEEAYPLVIVGAPLKYCGKLYNCAVAIKDGQILAVVPKTHLPNSGDRYELRHFASGEGIDDGVITLLGTDVPFGTNLLLQHDELENYCIGIELGEDLWAPETPGGFLTAAGATILAHPAATDEAVGKADYRRTLTASVSARLCCGYVSAEAGMNESTQDSVFAQHHLIAENGTVLAENPPFGAAGLLISEIDIDRLASDRSAQTAFLTAPEDACAKIFFTQPIRETALTRKIEKNPFVPADAATLRTQCETILQIQAHGLKKRIAHAYAKTAVIGISGGLDSCLALLVAVRAFDLL
ncbi:MAG: NAD(+) synthase, partial [Oscillospiraceae bacterium]|nr:NAD(+) synthase [Oscillospiraceae bacterium]